MGASAMVSFYMSIWEPRSLMFLVGSTFEGEVLIGALAIVGLAAVLDAVINDFLPDRFHWRLAVKQRHFIYTAMAFCYMAQLYVAYLYLRSSGLLVHYLCNVLAIMAVAYFDAHQRCKDSSCVITTS